MKRRVLKVWCDYFRRRGEQRFLLLHYHGKFEYRNPDSVYIHRFETFANREAAERYLRENIAPVDLAEWTLFETAAGLSGQGKP